MESTSSFYPETAFKDFESSPSSYSSHFEMDKKMSHYKIPLRKQISEAHIFRKKSTMPLESLKSRESEPSFNAHLKEL